MDWILIETNYKNKCSKCKNEIDIGDSAYWKKGEGLKCYPECITVLIEDDSKLIILDDDFEDYLK